MQRSAELTVINQARGEIAKLLEQAIEHHQHCVAARSSVANAQQLAMWHAWQSGIRLNQMKPLIAAGDWEDWVELNFCGPLEVSLRTAQTYMKIDKDNQALRDQVKAQRVAPAKADLQLLTKLKFDTIRKYAIGFVPEKEKPELKGNVKFKRSLDHMKVINEWNRWKYRRDNRQIASDPAEERRDFRALFEWMQEELYPE